MKWIFNNDEVLKAERLSSCKFILVNGVKEKVLGIQWDIKNDYFTFDICVNKKIFN